MMTSWKRLVFTLASILAIIAVLTLYVGNRHTHTAKAAGVCIASSSIQSKFNGTRIPAGDFIWFTSVLKVQGLPASLTEVDFQNQTIQFTVKGQNYNVVVPNASTLFNPATKSAAVSTPGYWQTAVPYTIGGNAFMSGFAFKVPAGGFPGGINPVWSGQFVLPANTPLTINWGWTAAVYSSFNWNYTQLGIKPVHDNHLSQYQNADRVGTPENYKSFVVGGARGGNGTQGGSPNYTGELSATASVPTNQCGQSGSASWDSLIGGWNDQVTFMSGPFQGQIETTAITFNNDGTLTETTTGPTGTGSGTGAWFITGFDQNSNATFQYNFDEPQPGGGDVYVTQNATLASDGVHYTSSGNGQFILNNQVLFQANTSISAVHN